MGLIMTFFRNLLRSWALALQPAVVRREHIRKYGLPSQEIEVAVNTRPFHLP
jgi:hypothetical protein